MAQCLLRHTREENNYCSGFIFSIICPQVESLMLSIFIDSQLHKEICLNSTRHISLCDANAQFHLLFGNVSHKPSNTEIYLIVHLYPVISTRMHEWSKQQILDASIVIENMLKSLNDAYMSSSNEADNANRCKSLCILSECLVHFLLAYICDAASRVTRKRGAETETDVNEREGNFSVWKRLCL